MSDLRQVHEWFLQRGLPLVLTRRVRSRALVERSAPMVSGIGALTAVTMLLAELTGDNPDIGYVIRLGIIAAVLVAAPFVLYLLHRTDTTLSEASRRSAALLVMAIFVVVMPITASGWSTAALAEAPAFVLVSLLAIWLTYLGFGSIALWAFRFAFVQFGALGTLMSCALPRAVAAVRPDDPPETLADHRIPGTGGHRLHGHDDPGRSPRPARRPVQTHRPAALLAGTPLAGESGHQPARSPLSVAEQVNVVAVMVVSQATSTARESRSAVCVDLSRGVIEPIGPPGRERDCVALTTEPERGRLTDAATTGTDDNDYLVSHRSSLHLADGRSHQRGYAVRGTAPGSTRYQ
ncbi:MAG: hypothetical protein JWR37_6009 [Mycobacterium sp.]|nr:hypothetical protein [Mycobacterium sp.]